MTQGGYSIRVDGVGQVLAQTPINEQVRQRIIRFGLSTTGRFVQGQVMRRTPVRTGQTRSRITMRLSMGLKQSKAIIGGKSIAQGFDVLRGLEEGTGLWGPKKKPITPRKAKALRWQPSRPISGSATGGAIFRKSVKGMKPRAMFARTYQADTPRAVHIFKRSVAQATAAAKSKPVI